MWLFISEVFRFEILGFEQIQGAFYKVFVGRLASLTRKRFASGRFRTCDEWKFEVDFRRAVIVHLLSRLIHLSLSVHWPVANS